MPGRTVPHRTKLNYPEYKPEGYRVLTEKNGNETVTWILGSDARATLFGVGYLLRKMVMKHKEAYLNRIFDEASATDTIDPRTSVGVSEYGEFL